MTNKKDLPYLSATELVDLLASKKISSLELLEETISRIESIDKKINAIPVRDFDQARASAKVADVAIAQGKRSPLLGLPISVKESFNVTGLPTTWANVQFKNWYPQDDAVVIARLKEAGAIIIGKSNVPFMLWDWQTYNDMYGTTNNPWDINVTPGGSSGGSAAALAAGLVSLELGSDLAGSLRTPAHFCGVYAHKPSQDLVPLRGSAPPGTPLLPSRMDFVVAGPMARTVADLTLSLNILAGPDDILDGKGYKLTLPSPRHEKLKDFSVLVIDQHPLCPTAKNITTAIDVLVDQVQKLGVKVSRNPKNIPDLANIARNYALLLAAYGAADTPIDMYKQSEMAAKELDDDDTLSSCFLRGSVIMHRDWLLATRTRSGLRQQWRNIFKEFDVIICPAMPTCAFPHDHSDPLKRQLDIDGVKVSYGDQFIWASIATLFGLPATVMPIAQTKDGLPIGVQIIGDYLEDHTTLKFASLFEREFAGFTRPHL